MIGHGRDRKQLIDAALQIASVHAAWTINVHLPRGKRISARQLYKKKPRIGRLPPGKTAAVLGQELVELAAKWRRDRAEREKAGTASE